MVYVRYTYVILYCDWFYSSTRSGTGTTKGNIGDSVCKYIESTYYCTSFILCLSYIPNLVSLEIPLQSNLPSTGLNRDTQVCESILNRCHLAGLQYLLVEMAQMQVRKTSTALGDITNVLDERKASGGEIREDTTAREMPLRTARGPSPIKVTINNKGNCSPYLKGGGWVVSRATRNEKNYVW